MTKKITVTQHAASSDSSQQQSGFSVRAAVPTNPTEAQAGARRDALPAMGIPEGGRFAVVHAATHDEPAFSLPDASGVGVLPEVFASVAVRSAVWPAACAAGEASAPYQPQPEQLYTLTLTRAQLFTAWSAVERSLNQTRKDIRLGNCVEADLTVEHALYRMLLGHLMWRSA